MQHADNKHLAAVYPIEGKVLAHDEMSDAGSNIVPRHAGMGLRRQQFPLANEALD